MKLRTCHHLLFAIAFCPPPQISTIPSLHQLQSKFHVKRHRNYRAVVACRSRWCVIQAIHWRWRSCANARCTCSHRSVPAAVRLGYPSSRQGNSRIKIITILCCIQLNFVKFSQLMDFLFDVVNMYLHLALSLSLSVSLYISISKLLLNFYDTN